MNKKISLIYAFSISAVVLSPISSAQNRFLPFFDENMQSKIMENTVSATSDMDIRLIPDLILYRSVFRRILNSESTLSQLSENDIDLIWDLPEHSNARFINPFRETLAESCETITEEKGMTVREIAEVITVRDFFLITIRFVFT